MCLAQLCYGVELKMTAATLGAVHSPSGELLPCSPCNCTARHHRWNPRDIIGRRLESRLQS
jgi:hypothetical protein